MTITIPTFTAKEKVVRPDLLEETPDPRTDVTHEEWNALTGLAVETATAFNAGGGGPAAATTPPLDVALTSSLGSSPKYALEDHVHKIPSAIIDGQKSTRSTAFTAVDGVYLVDASAGDVVVTLPAIASGRPFVVIRVAGSGAIKLTPTGSDRINGVPASYALYGAGSWYVRRGDTGAGVGWWVEKNEVTSRTLVTGVQFGATGYAVGTAGEYTAQYRRLRMIWAPVSLPGTGFRIAAGTDSGTGGGIGLITEPLSGASNGSLRGWDGAYFTPITHPTHFISAAELGRVVVDDLVLDDPNNLALWYRDGRLVGIAQTDAQTDWSHTLAMAINCRPNDPTNASYRFGDLIVFELQTSTVMPDADTVLDEAVRPPGWVVDGSVDLWVGEEFSSGTWTARGSGRVLTVTNGTAGVQKPFRAEPTKHGCWSLHSDSFGVREPGPAEGNSWRKYYLDIMSAAGFLPSAGGEYTSSGVTTKDFDFRHNCVPGQALGLANGAIPARLPTLAAALTSFCPKDGTLTLDYGRNDAYARCAPPSGGLGQSVSVAVAAFFTDLESAISAGHSHMNPGRPIIVADILRTDITYGTLNEREFGRVVSELLPAKVAKWRRTYRPQIGLAKVRAKVTPTQATANDDAVLWDGIHMASGAPMQAYAQAHAEAFFEVMGYPQP